MSDHIIPRTLGETASMAFERHGSALLARDEAALASRHHPPDIYCAACEKEIATDRFYCAACRAELDARSLRHRAETASKSYNVHPSYVALLLCEALERLERAEAEIAELREGA